jgi:membrane-associated phospholipid phosphatase
MNVRILIALAALAAIWTAMLLFGAGDVDREVLLRVYVREYPWIVLVAIGLTYLGSWPAVVVVTLAGAAWLFYRKRQRAALLLLVASFAGRVLVILQKAYFARLRPEEHIRLVEVHYESFPSGHSANTMIAFVALALLAAPAAKRAWAAGGAILLSMLIGLSRPMLGVHWPSDVLGGWAFGLFWVILLFALSSRIYAGRPPWALDDRSH